MDLVSVSAPLDVVLLNLALLICKEHGWVVFGLVGVCVAHEEIELLQNFPQFLKLFLTVHVRVLADVFLFAIHSIQLLLLLILSHHFFDPCFDYSAFECGHVKKESEAFVQSGLWVSDQVFVPENVGWHLFGKLVNHVLVVFIDLLGHRPDPVLPPFGELLW